MSERQKRPARALGEIAGKVIAPAVAKRGFAVARIVTEWAAVAGHDVAAVSQPERIVWARKGREEPGVLVLRVEGPAAVLIQHRTDQIVERVNRFVGYRAVGRIRLVQGTVATRPEDGAPAARGLTPQDEAAVEATLDGVEDGDLRDALARLGHGVFTDRD